ncbi:MAG: SHOCT domain-containing protein [Methanobacterium sp.]|nr:SHOCT domain-containing protein [Methanobacterium sp.]
MVSSDEIKRRLEAKRKGIEYQERVGRGPTTTKECPSCHTLNPSTAKFCVGCGKKLETPEPETEFKPDIKSSETSVHEETEVKKVTSRPDDFGSISQQRIKTEDSEIPPKPASEKLEPIVPPTPEDEAPSEDIPTAPEPEPVEEESVSEPPQVKHTIPEIVTPKSPAETEPEAIEAEKPTTEQKSELDVDPVERIKKAKELLDIGAITQEEFDMIKNKYLDLL